MSKEFGPLLRQLRLRAGHGLRKFAKAIGEAPSNLSAIETGARNPWRMMDKLRKVADALLLQEGSAEWDTFFISARREDALHPDLDRLLSRELNVSLLRAVDDRQFSDDQLKELVEGIRKQRFPNAKKRSRRRTN